MTLYQIALRHLERSKGKLLFMLLGLIIGAATVVAIYTIVATMQRDINQQLADLGANIVITADRGELTFQYGGITIPELVFAEEVLTVEDLQKLEAIPAANAIIAVAPKIIGTVESDAGHLVIAGTDLPAEFAVKPWLRFSDELNLAAAADSTENSGSPEMAMDYELLNLARMAAVPALENNQIVIGKLVAHELQIEAGDSLTLAGRNYNLLAVLAETGQAEDNQVMMNLTEAQHLLNRPGKLTIIEVASDFSLAGEEMLIGQLEEALPTAKITGVRQAVENRNELVASFSRFGFFAALLVILTGLLIVVLTVSAAVRERTREIGIFRAIGFRGKHILTIILTESIIVSVISGIIGYHIGLLSAHLLGPIVAGPELNIAAVWQPLVLLAVIASTMVLGLLASLIPARKAAQLDPAEALRFI